MGMPRGLVLVVVSLGGLAAGLVAGRYLLRPPPPPVIGASAQVPPATAPASSAAAASPATATSAVVAITSTDQLARLLAGHPGPVLLDFHAEWCQPCKELSPRVEQLAAKRPALLVGSVDVIAVDAVAKAFNAEDLPMLVRLEGGKEVARRVGAPTLPELERWLDEAPKAPITP